MSDPEYRIRDEDHGCVIDVFTALFGNGKGNKLIATIRVFGHAKVRDPLYKMTVVPDHLYPDDMAAITEAVQLAQTMSKSRFDRG